MRLRCSACLLALALLAACGGGGGEQKEPAKEAPPPKAGVAPPAPPAAVQGEEEVVEAMLVLLTADVDEGKAPLKVKLETEIDGGKAPYTYLFTFDDGSPPSTEASPSHTFEKPGMYEVRVTVKDSADSEDKDYLVIAVK